MAPRRLPRARVPGRSARPLRAALLSAGVAAAAALLRGPSFVPALSRCAGPRSARLGEEQRHSRVAVRALEESGTEPAKILVKDLRNGQELKGKVTNVIKMGAFVDIGAERPGLVPRNKMSLGFTSNVADVAKAGDEVTIWVSEATPEKLILSLVKEKAPRDLSAFEGIGPSEWLSGKVERLEPFGAFVSIKSPANPEQEAQGLVHTSKMGRELLVDEEVQVRVLDVDTAKGRLSLSMLQDSADGGEDVTPSADLSLFESAASDEWLVGTVDSVSPFGAFVLVSPPGSDLKAKGLVHKTQISQAFVSDATQEVSAGQEVQVRVLDVDAAGGKLSLSMVPPKAKPETADLTPFQELESSQWLPAKVVRHADYGIFVDVKLPNGVGQAQGLVHITEMRDGFVDDVTEEVEMGQDVQVRVVNVDVAAGKLGLSMKKPEGSTRSSKIKAPPADLSLFQDVDTSEWLTGKVASISGFGAFVDVRPPNGGEGEAQGLVHITQIRDGFVSDVSDEVEIGQEVKVRVLRVDAGSGKLSLSMKGEQSLRREELVAFEGVPDTVWLKGSVIAIKNFGALVEVVPPEGGAPGMGMVHISQISDDHVDDVGEVLEIGQSVQVRTLSVDADIGRLSLSMREKVDAPEMEQEPEFA